jgi:hypothetical protein
LAGGQCIGDDEILTHHTKQRGQYVNAPDARREVELSVMRGRLTVAAAYQQRNGGLRAHPADVEKAAVRYTTAKRLREQGFVVVHTCGPKGEENGHISVVWPTANPLDEPDPNWPPNVQEAFASCFPEQEV